MILLCIQISGDCLSWKVHSRAPEFATYLFSRQREQLDASGDTLPVLSSKEKSLDVVQLTRIRLRDVDMVCGRVTLLVRETRQGLHQERRHHRFCYESKKSSKRCVVGRKLGASSCRDKT